MECTSCGSVSPQGMRFCGHCGAPLTAPAGTAAERRQLTVLFCDLVASTALAERLGDEGYRDVLDAFQGVVAEEVERHGGHLAQLLGDGVLVYFGFPVAHEESADRAVRTACRIVQRLREQAATPDRVEEPLATRIGIHTGPVVIEREASVRQRRDLAVGSAPNVAARLQEMAPSNGVLVSGATHRLLRNATTCRPLGSYDLRGVSTPVEVFQVLVGDAVPPQVPSARPFSRSPMVNREQELALLAARWEAARGGAGVAVVVTGEAGIGKSRLVGSFAESAAEAGRARVLVTGCSALQTESALFPLRQLLRQALRLSGEESTEVQLERLRLEVAQHLPEEPEALPVLATFLALPWEEPWLPAATAALRRRVTHRILREWLFAHAVERPLIFVLEDLHWADPSTKEWLERMLAGLGERRVMFIATSRPGVELGGGRGVTAEVLALSGLEQRHSRELVAGIAGRQRLSQRWLERLVDQTDGVPLYVEELTHVLLESAVEERSPETSGEWRRLEIPTSLQDLLTARLDRLGEAKGLAQWAATLGRTFSLSLLREVVPEDEEVFDRHRRQLTEAGIFEWDPEGAGRGRFRHSLLQEAAYASLLKSDRRQRHLRVAETVVGSGGDVTAPPEEVAHHFNEAAAPGRAMEWWWRAGEQALRRSDNVEAIAHLRRGLAAIEQATIESREPEILKFKSALGTALVASRGYAAEEVAAIHDAVCDLARRLGSRRAIFLALRRTLPFYLVRAEHRKAERIGQELVEIAARLRDPALELEAHLALATACFWLGEVALCRDHAERGVELYRPGEHARHAVDFGQDPGVLSHLYAAWSHWWLGDFDRARGHFDAALDLARGLDHKHSLVMALDHGCALMLYLREWEAAQELVEEQRELSRRYGFAMWAAMANYRQAWLDCLAGELESGIARMERSIAAFRATGAEIARPLHLSFLARAHLLAGEAEKGLAALDEAFAAVERNGEHHIEPELHRLRGELELLRDGGKLDRAGGSLRTALEDARRRGCRALELRAALSWHQATRDTELADGADRELRDVYARFTASGDVPDLRDARAVLENQEAAC